MTFRDELVELIRSLPEMPGHRWADACAHFVDDHGPALLKVLDRYRHLRNVEGVVMLDDPESRIYHDAADKAIDRAREGV